MMRGGKTWKQTWFDLCTIIYDEMYNMLCNDGVGEYEYGYGLGHGRNFTCILKFWLKETDRIYPPSELYIYMQQVIYFSISNFLRVLCLSRSSIFKVKNSLLDIVLVYSGRIYLKDIQLAQPINSCPIVSFRTALGKDSRDYGINILLATSVSL